MNEIKLTNHAVMRLFERYDIKLKRELDAIRFLVSLKKFYVIKEEALRNSLTITVRLNGKIIGLVFNPTEKTVVTVLNIE